VLSSTFGPENLTSTPATGDFELAASSLLEQQAVVSKDGDEGGGADAMLLTTLGL